MASPQVVVEEEAAVVDSLENLMMRSIERFMASRFSERHGVVTSYDSKKYLAKVMLKPQDQESGWLPIETGHIGKGYGIAVGLKPGEPVDPGDLKDQAIDKMINETGDQGIIPPAFQRGDEPGGGAIDPNSPLFDPPQLGDEPLGRGAQNKMGDQVIVRFEEGDFESGKIVQRVHSNEDTPPEVKAGEMVAWTKFDQKGGGAGGAGGGGGGGGAGAGGSQNTGQKIFWKEDGSISVEDGAGAKQVMDGKGNMTLTAL